MKTILTSIITAVIVSALLIRVLTTDVAESRLGLHGGQVIKNTDQQIIQERIEETKRTTNLSSDLSRAIEAVQPSLVLITEKQTINTFDIRIGGGNGIIVAKDGYILTNKHVVANSGATYLVTTYDGETYTTERVWRDPNIDIAILKVVSADKTTPISLTPARIAGYRAVQPLGQFVVSISHAAGQSTQTALTTTTMNDSLFAGFGIISAKNQPLATVSGAYTNLYQTTIQLKDGFSGSPLLNAAGEIIGINTAILPNQATSFAIPLTSEFIQATLQELDPAATAISNDTTDTLQGTIIRPVFGATTTFLTKTMAKQLQLTKFSGIYISNILSGSLAAQAGFLSGDVITELDGQSLDNASLDTLLLNYTPGTSIPALIYRNKEYKKITISLPSSPIGATGATTQ